MPCIISPFLQLSIMSSQSLHRALIKRATGVLSAILVLALLMARFWQSFRDLHPIPPVAIHWGNSLQTMDGFGATQVSEVPLTPAEADFFFSPSGLGFSIIRTVIIPTLQDCTEGENYLSSLGYKMNPANCQTVAFGPTNRSADILAVRQAVARGVTTVLATAGSPPGSMKSNGRYYQGGTFLGDLGSVKATGRSYELRGSGFFRVVGGKITLQRGYWDKASWYTQIGISHESVGNVSSRGDR